MSSPPVFLVELLFSFGSQWTRLVTISVFSNIGRVFRLFRCFTYVYNTNDACIADVIDTGEEFLTSVNDIAKKLPTGAPLCSDFTLSMTLTEPNRT
jgi:hypothetical protein